MKYAFTEVCINPDQPYKQAGFAQQVNKIFTVHDDLYARIAYFETEEVYIHCSLDNLGIQYPLQVRIQKSLEEILSKKVYLVISCTHTHFAPNARDEGYQEFLHTVLVDAVKNQNITETDQLEYTFTYEHFEEVGKSRITSSPSKNIFAEMFSVYDQGKRIANFIIHNCHPTIMNGMTPFFSAEYPGYTLRLLKKQFPGEYFTFLQGADGDISTRFTRTAQNYQNVMDLGDKMVKECIRLMEKPQDKKRMELSFFHTDLPLEHQMRDVDNIVISENLSQREKDTIEYGIQANLEMRKNLASLPSYVPVSCMKFGNYRMIFIQYELFSSYIDALCRPGCSLVCYSNGYGPYVTSIGFTEATYESLKDSISEKTKETMIELFARYSQI